MLNAFDRFYRKGLDNTIVAYVVLNGDVIIRCEHVKKWLETAIKCLGYC